LQIFFKFFMTSKKIVVLGTGGTIAGTAASSSDHTGYTAAQLSVAQLLRGVPRLAQALRGDELVSEQVAQLDSKDMDAATMTRLAQRCAHHLSQADVRGIVVTHGTDTLEETAYFLHLVLTAVCPALQSKPVVLTCAMRPATSSEADGPRNLHDAVLLARDAHEAGANDDGLACGVLVVCAGDVHHATRVQKVSTYALNAFSSGSTRQGPSGMVATIEADRVRWEAAAASFLKKNQPLPGIESAQNAHYLIAHPDPQSIEWPRVEIIMNHVQQDGGIVHALLQASTVDDPLRGIVVAATGNGTVSEKLQAALELAQRQGVEVALATRCVWDEVPGVLEAPSMRQAAKARVGLMLRLLKP
jgi:L-asparaginase